jgi:hypothetical protein
MDRILETGSCRYRGPYRQLYQLHSTFRNHFSSVLFVMRVALLLDFVFLVSTLSRFDGCL